MKNGLIIILLFLAGIIAFSLISEKAALKTFKQDRVVEDIIEGSIAKFSSSALESIPPGQPGFTRISSNESGIDFINTLKDEQAVENQIRQNGSGVTAGDLNQDGLVDLYFTRLDGSNVLYQNLGNFKFKDVTPDVLKLTNQFSSGTVSADMDGDSDLDILVTGLDSGVRLFLNEGDLKFKEATLEAGLTTNLGSTTMAVADIDGDADLDLYVANYRNETIKDFGGDLHLQLSADKKTLIVPPELEDRFTVVNNTTLREHGEPDYLFINEGNGKFREAAWTDGRFLDEDGNPLKKKTFDWGLSVVFRDFDGDLDPDIYVCNDFASPDRIWVNDGKGNFRAIDKLSIRSTSVTSMGMDLSDIDRDGHYDMFIVDMLSRHHLLRKTQMGNMQPTPISIGEIDNRPQIMRNTVLKNWGDNTYAEIGNLTGLHASEWSWQPVFFDIDLDGYEDVYITNGHQRDAQDSDTSNYIKTLGIKTAKERRESLLLYPRLATENVAFRNTGDLHFEEAGKEWGLEEKIISHGVALADLDNDGDLDLVTNNLEDEARVYRNNASAPRILVRLKGLAPNTQGIGADVRLIGGPVLQNQQISSGGKYLSSSDTALVFAAKDLADDARLEITWRSGRKNIVQGIKPNHSYVIEEGESDRILASLSKTEIEKATAPVMFEDVSSSLGHSHHENAFDDFERQPLLPNRLSQLGPGVAWYDVNQDGNQDLIIGSGTDGLLTVLQNDGSGNFKPVSSGPLRTKIKRDMTGIVAWREKEDEPSFLVGLSNFEDGKEKGFSANRYSFKEGQVNATLGSLGQESSTGPLAMSDIDSDGDLDLFIGGRTIPGQYPKPATSMILKNTNGRFVLDKKLSKPFEKVGLTTAAIFSDINSDSKPDLLIALEWGPIRVYINEGNSFSDNTEKLGFADYQGWWNGITTGDFDNDGKLDIVATNWGRNHKYHFNEEHPLKVYYKHFDDDGKLDVVEAHVDERTGELVPERGFSCSSTAMPFIKEKITTFKDFGLSNLDNIYGSGLKDAEVVTANDLDHRVFLNRGERFESKSLPLEAQFAPAFGVNVADFNGDGNEDIFITQNFFASQIETPRIDAGRGLLLEGDGKGDFKSVPGHLSGIKVFGDMRGSAVADYNNDGRIDLVVAQNGAATKLYKNTAATPGLRVKLKGSKGNFDAVGASIRLKYADQYGPVREIHSGSGYWSQDSTVQVMAAAQQPSKVWVRWPSGEETEFDIPRKAKEITISQTGIL